MSPEVQNEAPRLSTREAREALYEIVLRARIYEPLSAIDMELQKRAEEPEED